MNRRYTREQVQELYRALYSNGKYEYDEEGYLRTISCRDTDYIPKVENAGKIITHKGHECQVMHNGVKILKGCYHQDHLTDIIENLKGHHEPQEEKLFYEILKYIPDNGLMIEVGSFWAYYSMWFNREVKNARNIMIEPDFDRLEIGEINFHLNDMSGEFIHGFISPRVPGNSWSRQVWYAQARSGPYCVKKEPERLYIDDFLERENIQKVDLLHCDGQECEIELLGDAEKSLESHKIKFLFLSTHKKEHT
ncbi:MAG TPA: hypothetical protein DEG69_20750, partial [Flavobacteriaceae bacterium]|nr:hypothetical protein [Flavobacteriaceae bacterium]